MTVEAFIARYRGLLTIRARQEAWRFRGDIAWEDLMQEGLLRVCRAARSFNGKCPAPAWMLMHYRWGMRDGLRKMARPWDATRRRGSGVENRLSALRFLSVPPDVSFDGACIMARARQGGPVQEFVVLALIDGWQQSEIAEVLGVSAGRVCQIVRQVRERVRREVA